MHNLLKFIPLLAVVAFAGNAMGASSGSPTQISYDGNQAVDDDEFLYENEKNYKEAKAGYDRSNHQNSGYGVGYECDEFNKHNAFSTGNIVNMPPNHYFKGKKITQKKSYQCMTIPGDDYWKELSDSMCEYIYNDKIINFSLGQCITDNKGKCIEFDIYNCPERNDLDNGSKFKIICKEGPKPVCVPTICENGYKLVNNKCVKNDNSQNNTDYCAIDSIKEGAAVIGGCFKLWNGTNGLQNTCVSFTKDKCKQNKITVSDDHGKDFIANCLQNKTFECIPTSCENGYELKDGKCAKIGGNSPVKKNPTFKCPDDTEQLLNDWEREYGTNKGIMDLIKQIRELCQSKKPEEDGYNKLIVQIKVLIEQIKSEAKITELTRGLSDMQAKFTTSHWTDKEGNFNKKRLLSDSIAATVLGTTGGLITSHVMKKKQAENGFDALQCTVGGQSVASWGDEFTVGIQ